MNNELPTSLISICATWTCTYITSLTFVVFIIPVVVPIYVVVLLPVILFILVAPPGPVVLQLRFTVTTVFTIIMLIINITSITSRSNNRLSCHKNRSFSIVSATKNTPIIWHDSLTLVPTNPPDPWYFPATDVYTRSSTLISKVAIFHAVSIGPYLIRLYVFSRHDRDHMKPYSANRERNGRMERKNELTPLLPLTLILCVASAPGPRSALEIAFSCNFCVFGTAACRPTFDICDEKEVLLNLARTRTIPSALRWSCSVTVRSFFE